MITVFLSGFLFGGLTLMGLLKITAFLQLKKLQDEYNSTYNEIISLIGTNSVKFLSRYNDSVTFRVATKTKGKVDMIVFLDKKARAIDLCLFKKGDCVLSTQYADKKIIDGICQKLEDSFSKDMKDCVIIMGNIIDRKTMERINPNINFAPAFPEEVSEETDFTIDDILDRINQVGIDNLTDVEKNFLEQYQKDQK